MGAFLKYMHLERLGTSEVDGINAGVCYVFPKLDGTNASIWLKEDGTIGGGSRNRELSIESDNAGFYNHIKDSVPHLHYLKAFPHHQLYGEWLVPHSLKTYREDAWRKFYIFDVWDSVEQRWLTYEEYATGLENYGLTYLVPLVIIRNGSVADFYQQLERNTFYLKEGVGEGIVIKNYNFVNRYGRTVWAKLINAAFKEVHHAAMGAPIIGADVVEMKIVDKYVTQALVDKCYAKVLNEHDGEWSQKYIPQLLGMVFYDLVKEETWEYVKENKLPTINFKDLQRYCINKVKELKKELF